MHRITLFGAIALATPIAMGGAPQYTITNLGLADPSHFASQGLAISNGGTALGASFDGSSGRAFTWTAGTGLVPLPDDPAKPYAQANGANAGGTVVGTGADTFFGSGAVPLQWDNGSVSQLPILSGLGVGRANDVNTSGTVVGSSGGGVQEVATYWTGGAVNEIAATTPGGASMTTAFGVNDAGTAVGTGVDPANPARNVGLMYDINGGALTEVPALPGDNGTIAFNVSENGFIVGSSTQNQAGGLPFIWSESTGSVEIPLPMGATTGSGRGVNSDGWVVGNAGGQFAVPFLFDGDETHRIQDLIPEGSGWDLSMNTSSSALGISEDGSIVGTGVFNGEIRAYQMTIIPAPGSAALLGVGGLAFLRRRR